MKRRPNPMKDIDNKLSFLLSRQSCVYRNKDPKEKQQKALPFSVLNKLALWQGTNLNKAIVQLTIGAAFFACRSCKYSRVPRREQKQTKLLCLRNIRCFKEGHLLSASSDNLEFLDSVAITFKMQKNHMKHETVIHGQTDNVNLCPVLQWAHLVHRIWKYPSVTEDTPVRMIWHHGWLKQITSQHTIMALCAACTSIGSAKLGFRSSEIGTHLLQLGAAMELYLAGIPVYTIMLIGRWSSDAFLRYIQKQVEQFSKHVSKQMIQFGSFRTIPDIAPCMVLNKDPRQCNYRDNVERRNNIGDDRSRRVRLPAFSLFK
jgi:hypothetical protein